MPLTRILGFGLSIVIVVTIFSSVSSAQIKRPLRWLGQGFSDGYHRCNPGPNSDYYNPYSIHNSHLLHKYGANYGATRGSTSNGHQATWAGRIGVPFSVYAAPAPIKSDLTPKTHPGEIIDNSFVPFQPEARPSSDNDWQVIPDNTDKAIDDKKDSALVPQLISRVRQRSADAQNSPKKGFSILNR